MLVPKMMWPLFVVISFSFSTFASTISFSKLKTQTSPVETQYFIGEIQTTSLDGKIPYGPAVESVVKRIVNHQEGIISECVLQNDEVFLTTMTRTSNPLIFEVHDMNKSFTGQLHFADQSLSSWSYDINVLQPHQGRILGQLPERGAKIDLKNKTMQIKKVWNDQVLISENYKFADEVLYAEKLKSALIKNSNPNLSKNCQ